MSYHYYTYKDGITPFWIRNNVKARYISDVLIERNAIKNAGSSVEISQLGDIDELTNMRNTLMWNRTVMTLVVFWFIGVIIGGFTGGHQWNVFSIFILTCFGYERYHWWMAHVRYVQLYESSLKEPD